jgi:hypothetical protein
VVTQNFSSGRSWGGDRTVVLRRYRVPVCSKTDCGSSECQLVTSSKLLPYIVSAAFGFMLPLARFISHVLSVHTWNLGSLHFWTDKFADL